MSHSKRGFAADLLAAGGIASAVALGGPTPTLAQEIARASFNEDGSVNRPEDWRAWIFVGESGLRTN